MTRSTIEPEFDLKRLSDFDASFWSDRFYRVSLNDLSVEIKEEKFIRPLYKTYSLDLIKQEIAEADLAIVAEEGEGLSGIATVKYEEWNNRAHLTGIYVAPESKGKGLGHSLIETAIDYAKSKSARCMFVETQNINYPAICFYRKMNFEFCGFDTALYNLADVDSKEIAFYFCKNLSNENS